MNRDFSYTVNTRLSSDRLGRTGVISTPHGQIKTPAFVVVATKATVKALTPEQVSSVNAQAVLANAYHLYLQPGHKLIEEAGGLSKFMNWPGPTFTDSGGFQVLSLGSGYKKVIDMVGGEAETIAKPKKAERKAFVDTDGVTFYSHLDGSRHRFTAELSMQIQHGIGADIMFAFDELTSLIDPYDYQVESLKRTEAWAKRCIIELDRLRKLEPRRPYQALFGVVQGAQYEDLRRKASKTLAELPFDGFGIGGAIEKYNLGKIVEWVNQELPEDKPKHLLGISEPDDIFAAIENGVDTFDCVSPTRVGRNGSAYTYEGRKNIVASRYKHDFGPVIKDCNCYTCQNYSSAYLNHLLHAHELLANTLMSIHNEHFIIKLVDDIRHSIEDGSFDSFREAWLAKYYTNKQTLTK
jgi:queuine tRNA-ribosyltransferase